MNEPSGSRSDSGPLLPPLKARSFLKDNGTANDGDLWTALASREVQAKHFAQLSREPALHEVRNSKENVLAAKHAGLCVDHGEDN